MSEADRISDASVVRDLGGVRLRAIVEGTGSPALVIGSSRYYPKTFSLQLRASLYLAFLDARHFAPPILPLSAAQPIGLATYLDDLETLRAGLGFERAVVIGHSHHGNLALEYALHYPERVSHLVLIGSPPVAAEDTARAAELYWEQCASGPRKQILRRNLDALGSEALARMTPEQAYVTQYLAEAPRYWYDPCYDATGLWQGMPLDMQTIRAFRDFFGAGYQVQERLQRLSIPALVVMGRHDYAVPHGLWGEARCALPRLAYHLFDRSGHTPQLEEPGRFDQLLLDWLGAPERRA